jgi:hypothetical protein
MGNEIVVTVSQQEAIALAKFLQEHEFCASRERYGISFDIINTPTAIGMGVSVKCRTCGKVQNITDYDIW